MSLPNIVELNVGGKSFTTSLTTLMKDPDSMLAAMFSGRHPPSKDKDGRYFIDCDGDIFSLILEYLRFGTIPTRKMAPRVLKYADYFNIAALKKELEMKYEKRNQEGNMIIGKEPLESVYNHIFDRIIGEVYDPDNMPICVRFEKSKTMVSRKKDCKHRIESLGYPSYPDGHIDSCSKQLKYNLTEKLFDQVPHKLCNDISQLGHFVKYTVCDCSPEYCTAIIIYIAYFDETHRPSNLEWTIVDNRTVDFSDSHSERILAV